ncbi:hypothetical protein BU26DRAFT_486262 [Trematosphaeria pertusa]|uniref:Uncharacterized protein n=1 Tax=Trematosphaeria pertusa TaxID=390896 RepID=A0A6A6ID80_9PLEO|nr:uncharacterized protein BU26DRAFT_486262 [Trematosphaeria pertusa]KAF2248534.1 hypothetical protein BU26DRAFT_486262 [Trematosphaeria pertusa]
MLMCHGLAGAYFVTATQSVFANSLLRLGTASDIDPIQVLATGASEIQHVSRSSYLVTVLHASVFGIKDVFVISFPGAAFTVLCETA